MQLQQYHIVGYHFPKHIEVEGTYSSLEQAIIGANLALLKWTCVRIMHVRTGKSVAEMWRDEGQRNQYIKIHYDTLQVIIGLS